LLADIREQRHEPRALDRRAGRALERRATAAALAGKHLVLVGAEFLEQADVLVIHVGRPRASLGRAETAVLLAVASELSPRHNPFFLSRLCSRASLREGARHDRAVETTRNFESTWRFTDRQALTANARGRGCRNTNVATSGCGPTSI